MKARKRKAIQSAEKFMEGLCQTYSYDIDLIKSSRRLASLVEKRAIVAQRLREQGFSLPVIGIVMNRHHTSILHLVNEDIRERSKKRCRDAYFPVKHPKKRGRKKKEIKK